LTNQSVLEKPKTRAQVIAWIVEGKRDAEIASMLKTQVSRQAIHQFRKRHAAEITPVVKQLDDAIIDVALKDKESRIRELAWLYGLARDEAVEHGITITETHYEGRGETRDEYVTRDFRTGMVKEMRGLLHDIAEEMGQLEKGYTDNRIQILVRSIVGYDTSALG
jgi:hypothetical protein